MVEADCVISAVVQVYGATNNTLAQFGGRAFKMDPGLSS